MGTEDLMIMWGLVRPYAGRKQLEKSLRRNKVMAKVTDVKTLDDITKGKPLAEIRYTDLADIIFILQDQANAYHGLDECCDELTVDQFTEWLGTMKGSVELVEIIPRPKD